MAKAELAAFAGATTAAIGEVGRTIGWFAAFTIRIGRIPFVAFTHWSRKSFITLTHTAEILAFLAASIIICIHI